MDLMQSRLKYKAELAGREPATYVRASRTLRGRSLKDNLRQRVGTGGIWSAATRLADQGLNALVMVVLARILGPESIGLLGMLLVLLFVGESLADGGFGRALVQGTNIEHPDESSVFFFNLLVGITLTCIMFVGSEALAHFYREPRVAELSRLLCPIMVFNSLAVVPASKLARELNYRPLFWATFPALLIAGSVALGGAFRGVGVASLAIHLVGFSMLRSLFLWMCVAWRPALDGSWDCLRRLAPFGIPLLISGCLTAVFSEMVTITVGRLFSAGDVGFYVQASRLQRIPCDIAAFALLQVSFPALCILSKDRSQLADGFRQFIRVAAMIGCSSMMGLCVVSPSLVLALFGQEWMPMIPMVQKLCAVGIFFPLQAANISLMWATGRTMLALACGCASLAFQGVAIFATYAHGVEAMIVGQIAVALAYYLLLAHLGATIINFRIGSQLRTCLPSVIAGLGMAIPVYLLGSLLTPGLICLIAQVSMGMLLFPLISWFLQRDLMKLLMATIRDIRRA